MDVQWWIDAAGKLGPVSVAAAVLMATLAQNRWVNRVSRRNADVEDQKLRLALLEKRIAVLSDIEWVFVDWAISTEISYDTTSKLRKVITSAELIFPTEVDQLEACNDSLVRRRQIAQKVKETKDGSEAREAALTSASDQDRVIMSTFRTLRERLVAASKVEPVPPLPPSFFEQLFSRSLRNRN